MQVKLIIAQGEDKAGSVIYVSDKHGSLLIEQGVAEAIADTSAKKKED